MTSERMWSDRMLDLKSIGDWAEMLWGVSVRPRNPSSIARYHACTGGWASKAWHLFPLSTPNTRDSLSELRQDLIWIA